MPGELVVEDRLGDDVLDRLRRAATGCPAGAWTLGRLCAVARDPDTGVLSAAANPRGEGVRRRALSERFADAFRHARPTIASRPVQPGATLTSFGGVTLPDDDEDDEDGDGATGLGGVHRLRGGQPAAAAADRRT